MTGQDGFTPEEVMLVLKSAGFDPDRPLSEQIATATHDALQGRVKELEERLAEVTSKREAQPMTAQERHLAAAQQQGQRFLDGMRRDRIGPFGWSGEDEGDGDRAA
jgi:hypothetical protein